MSELSGDSQRAPPPPSYHTWPLSMLPLRTHPAVCPPLYYPPPFHPAGARRQCARSWPSRWPRSPFTCPPRNGARAAPCGGLRTSCAPRPRMQHCPACWSCSLYCLRYGGRSAGLPMSSGSLGGGGVNELLIVQPQVQGPQCWPAGGEEGYVQRLGGVVNEQLLIVLPWVRADLTVGRSSGPGLPPPNTHTSISTPPPFQSPRRQVAPRWLCGRNVAGNTRSSYPRQWGSPSRSSPGVWVCVGGAMWVLGDMWVGGWGGSMWVWNAEGAACGFTGA